MTPIDLLDFTHSKKKIPSSFLSYKGPEKVLVSNRRAMAALLLDFGVILTTTAMLSAIFKLYFGSYMISGHLEMVMSRMSFYNLSVSSLPLMFMSYFFFSYFFNHGQSWGMHVMKTRIAMPEQNFRTSFLWAIFSSSTVMTFGLAFFWARDFYENKGWGTFEGHDHLYINLVQEKEFSPVNLVELSQDKVEAKEEEYFVEAA